METILENAERLVDAYNKLDKYMRRKLNVDVHRDHKQLISDIEDRNLNITISSCKHFLKDIAELRNAIIHNPRQGQNKEYIASPLPEILEKYESLVEEILRPKAAISYAIAGNEIYYASLDARVVEISETMRKKKYSFVPILDDNGLLVGVFSESSLFTYFGMNKAINLDDSITLKALVDVVKIDRHDSERFKFVNRDINVFEVMKQFQQDIKSNKRLGMILFTHDGKDTSKILGLFTAWDALRLSKELTERFSQYQV